MFGILRIMEDLFPAENSLGDTFVVVILTETVQESV